MHKPYFQGTSHWSATNV